MTVDLFAGVPVEDYQGALAWYKRLLGLEPAFFPNATEAVWELAEHRRGRPAAHRAYAASGTVADP